VRHLHKYLFAPLPAPKRFYFHDCHGKYLGIVASSLWEFGKTLQTAPTDSLKYHLKRGDFERWLSEVLYEKELAKELSKLSHRNLPAEALRQALAQLVEERYEELEALI
jgi:alpha-amylase